MIKITSFYEAKQLVEQKPHFYRIVSISSPLDPLKEFYGAKDVLFLYFDDIIEESKRDLGIIQLTLPSLKDCENALDFLSKEGDILIHCYHGKSRSTAIALGFFLKKYGDYKHAVNQLLEIKPWATPNERIIKIMCSLLGMDADYINIINYLKQNRKQYLSAFSKQIKK